MHYLYQADSGRHINSEDPGALSGPNEIPTVPHTASAALRVPVQPVTSWRNKCSPFPPLHPSVGRASSFHHIVLSLPSGSLTMRIRAQVPRSGLSPVQVAYDRNQCDAEGLPGTAAHGGRKLNNTLADMSQARFLHTCSAAPALITVLFNAPPLRNTAVRTI